ncbi:MAG: BMP family ABC transporter substrate-binding protein, partial [Oscillospiraceae bacterium]|nr:BMP family ABC transporter substrate-binding protein [Oscillospiraceae bacterium]
ALAACGSTNDATPAGSADGQSAEPAATDVKVAMITDYGDITDQSFNQTTYEACKAFCEKNAVDFKYYKPTDDSTAARVEMIDQAIAEGYNVVVMPGYAFAGAIVETQDLYPDVKFVALDVSEYDITSAFYKTDADGNVTEELLDESNEPHVAANVYSAVYQEELCGYMAGVAAVKLGYTKLGFLGGMAVPAVIRYGYGFVQGASAAADELDTDIEINYVYGGQFYGDGDITAAMDTWYNAGTEVVFACGGGIYSSAAEAAAKVGGKVIGVDVDQAGIIDGDYGEGMTVTSAMKGLAATVDTMLGEILAGNWDNYGGKVETLGLVSGEDASLNYVQIPLESTQWSDSFTQDDYVALVASMVAGDVTVSNDISVAAKDLAGEHVSLTDQGQIK